MTTKIVLLKASAINKQIDVIGKTVENLDAMVHATAVQCMFHAQEHGDATLADRLIKMLGGKNSDEAVKHFIALGGKDPVMKKRDHGYFVAGLMAWFQKYSPITWNGDGKVGVLKAKSGLYKQLLERNNGEPWNVEAANLEPFWTMASVQRAITREPFTLESLHNNVIMLRNRVDNAVEAGTFMGDKDAAYAYIDALGKVEPPKEDESKIILPKAPNIKGTTYQPPAEDKAAENAQDIAHGGGDVVTDEQKVA